MFRFAGSALRGAVDQICAGFGQMGAPTMRGADSTGMGKVRPDMGCTRPNPGDRCTAVSKLYTSFTRLSVAKPVGAPSVFRAKLRLIGRAQDPPHARHNMDHPMSGPPPGHNQERTHKQPKTASGRAAGLGHRSQAPTRTASFHEHA